MTRTDATKRPLRADAVRNRAKIMDAARGVFAERGLDVTLDDIAARAGLGVGTVYRRFADRETLIEAIFEERMLGTLAQMRAALDDPDAWHGLITYIWATCEDITTDRGMRQVMLSGAHGREAVTNARIQLHELGRHLVARAQAQGALRSDFQDTDVPILLLMIAAVADFTGALAPDVWRRYLRVLIAGIRADAATGPNVIDLDSVDGKGTDLGAGAPTLSHEVLLQAISVWRPPTLPAQT